MDLTRDYEIARAVLSTAPGTQISPPISLHDKEQQQKKLEIQSPETARKVKGMGESMAFLLDSSNGRLEVVVKKKERKIKRLGNQMELKTTFVCLILVSDTKLIVPV